MWWLRKKRPRAGRKAQKVSGSKEPMITSLRVAVSKERSHRWRWWKILSRDHIKQCLLWLKEKRRYRNGMSRSCRRCFRVYSGGRLPGRSAKEKGREEEEEDENSKEKKVRNEIAQEVVAGIKEKAGVHEDAKSTAQRTVGQSVKQSWDCSQIENEEEEEEEDWQKEDQMEVQWAEDEKLEESLERRRMEGSSFAGGSHAKST